MDHQKEQRAQALQAEKSRKSKLKNRKDTSKDHATNIREARDTGGEVMVETIYAVR